MFNNAPTSPSVLIEPTESDAQTTCVCYLFSIFRQRAYHGERKLWRRTFAPHTISPILRPRWSGCVVHCVFQLIGDIEFDKNYTLNERERQRERDRYGGGCTPHSCAYTCDLSLLMCCLRSRELCVWLVYPSCNVCATIFYCVTSARCPFHRRILCRAWLSTLHNKTNLFRLLI